MNPLTSGARQTWVITTRYLRQLYREPAVIFITLTQPVIWLLLFGALFEKVAKIPGFGGGNYHTYLTPGVVVMTAIFASSWTGMSFIEDMQTGVMDRFLTAPVHRGGQEPVHHAGLHVFDEGHAGPARREDRGHHHDAGRQVRVVVPAAEPGDLGDLLEQGAEQQQPDDRLGERDEDDRRLTVELAQVARGDHPRLAGAAGQGVHETAIPSA